MQNISEEIKVMRQQIAATTKTNLKYTINPQPVTRVKAPIIIEFSIIEPMIPNISAMNVIPNIMTNIMTSTSA